LYALTTATLVAVQELNAKVQTQEDTIRRLEEKVAQLRAK